MNDILTSKNKAEIIYKLYLTDLKKPLNLKGVCILVDGTDYKSETYNFLYKLKDKNILIPEQEIIIKGKKIKLYKINKDAIEEMWQNTIYFLFSKYMIETEYVLLPRPLI